MSSNVNYFVFRINYDKEFEFIRNELLKGTLRQGWGASGMDVTKSVDEFSVAWQKNWGEEDSEKKITRKYNNICIMKEIKIDDIIIIPKVSILHEDSGRFFTVARCKKPYSFSLPYNEKNDFGHCIGIEPLFSVPYDFNGESQSVSNKFGVYRSALNRVYISDFCLAVDSLINTYKHGADFFSEQSGNYLKILSDTTMDARESYLDKMVGEMQKWQNKTLENIIEQLFNKNGYATKKQNHYDGEGGDIDLVFQSYNENTLLSNIYDLTDKDNAPDIYVQAKKKRHTDYNDINGIEQLLQMESKSGKHNILIVINLADDFTKDAKQRAEDNGVILLNGKNFASLLVRYGIDVDEMN